MLADIFEGIIKSFRPKPSHQHNSENETVHYNQTATNNNQTTLHNQTDSHQTASPSHQTDSRQVASPLPASHQTDSNQNSNSNSEKTIQKVESINGVIKYEKTGKKRINKKNLERKKRK